MKTFMQMVKDGDCKQDGVDDLFESFISVWHCTINVDDAVYDFLGVTEADYNLLFKDVYSFGRKYYGINK